MAPVAELRYVALKPLPIQIDGERLLLEPGDEIPDPDGWGRSLHANIEAGRIGVLPEPLPAGDVGGHSDPPSAAAAATLTDDELLSELAARGYTRPRLKS